MAKADEVEIVQDLTLASLLQGMGYDKGNVEVLEQDAGLAVDFQEAVEFFVGRYVGEKSIEQVRENTGEKYMAHLYSFEQVSSVNWQGQPEKVLNAKKEYEVVAEGTRRSVWGNFQIDGAMLGTTLGTTPVGIGDLVAIQSVGKIETGKGGRTLNTFNIAVVRNS